MSTGEGPAPTGSDAIPFLEPGAVAPSAVTPSAVPPSAVPPNAVPPRVNRKVFLGSAAGTLAVTLWALIAPEQAERVLGALVAWTSSWFGWFYVALGTGVLIFVIYLGWSQYGSTKLGPEHSQPEFSTMSWAAMLFAAGIGTDLMFFAVAGPVTHYLHPPNTEAETVAAARESVAWTLFHYGITGWGFYALMGMALAYFAYRMRLPLAIRSALAPVFGKRVNGTLGDTVDLAALLGTIFGVATSLGIGVVMVNVGLNVIFGLPVSIAAQIGIVVVGVGVATLSAVSGVDRGIKFLSLLNVFLAIGLTIWVLLAGKTQYLLDGLVLNIGDFIRLFPEMTNQTFAYQDPGTWMSDWTLFFWAWWIAWSSFVGLFLARISRGRTIRQFVVGTLTIPFFYILMWVSVYGNAALDLIRSGNREFGQRTVLTPEGGFYELLAQYPAFIFVAAIATITALLFYVTSADSAALVMANLSSHLPSPEHDGRAALRIFWALATGALTISVLIVGGVGALQSATVIMGLPFAFVLILVMIGLYRALRTEAYWHESAAQTLRASLSGRSSSKRGRARSWQHRLARALSHPSPAEADEFEEGLLLPTFAEIVDELAARGILARSGRTTADSGAAIIELEVGPDGEHAFHYQVWRREAALPAFGRRLPDAADIYVRMEVFLDGGPAQGYDIMGYSHAQLVDDVLDQYERHLEFLQLQERVTQPAK